MTPSIQWLALVTASLGWASGVYAQTLTDDEYRVAKGQLVHDYQLSQRECTDLPGSARKICLAQVQGDQAVAFAALAHSNLETVATQYKLRIAQAESVYAVARVKCDDLAGKPKAACVRDALATKAAARAQALAAMGINDAQPTLEKATAEARRRDKALADARSAIVQEQRAVGYRVALERCEQLTGDSRSACIATAKTRDDQ